MAIFFQAKQVRNPHNMSATPLFYARIKNISTLNEKELVERISSRTGISSGIISSVLRDSMDEVVNLVTLGYKVQLPSLGLLYLTLSSRGNQTFEEVTADSVKRISIRFLASSNFKSMVQNKSKLTNFSKLGSLAPSTEGDDENGADNSGDSGNTGGGSEDEGNNPL